MNGRSITVKAGLDESNNPLVGSIRLGTKLPSWRAKDEAIAIIDWLKSHVTASTYEEIMKQARQ